jgi:electron transfer flavoprotein beta subunit
MRIITAMKQVPDLQQMRIKDRKPVLSEASLTFGKIDKNALEAAVQLKEKMGGEVIVVSAGNEELENTIKEALAADADRAVLLADDTVDEMDSSQKALALARLINEIDGYNLIIFGEGSADNYSGQMGSRVAELLGLPQAGYVTSIKIEGDSAVVTRSLESQEEILEMKLPGVIIVAGDLNEPRIPSVTKVLKAGKKPIEVFELDDLNIDLAEKSVETISNLAPLNNRKGVKLNNINELVSVLINETAGGI